MLYADGACIVLCSIGVAIQACEMLNLSISMYMVTLSPTWGGGGYLRMSLYPRYTSTTCLSSPNSLEDVVKIDREFGKSNQHLQ